MNNDKLLEVHSKELVMHYKKLKGIISSISTDVINITSGPNWTSDSKYYLQSKNRTLFENFDYILNRFKELNIYLDKVNNVHRGIEKAEEELWQSIRKLNQKR